MIVLLSVITSVLYAAVAVLLVRKYRWSGDRGFLWLAVPLVLMPFAALPLALWSQAGVDQLVQGKQASAFPFSLVEQGRLTMGSFLTLLNLLEHVVWGAFALLALVVLKPRRSSDVADDQRGDGACARGKTK